MEQSHHLERAVLKVHEYQAKEPCRSHNIPGPEGWPSEAVKGEKVAFIHPKITLGMLTEF
jgi:succinyl-CoA synthetase beta subunit